MNILSRSPFIAGTMLLMVMPIVTQDVLAQTPAQMEYERQQREYRQQMERQQQEQQRQQQIMNENARRQQEESRRLNAPMGQSPTPAYPGATPQITPRQSGAQVNLTPAIADAEWSEIGSHTDRGGVDIYAARSTIRRSGNLVKIWEMFDFKTAQVVEGRRFISHKQLMEYDCKVERKRMLAVTAFTGHKGKGVVVESDNTPLPWETVDRSSVADVLRKFACDGK
jgi:hypothetical protein